MNLAIQTSTSDIEGAAPGFPQLRTSTGAKLAEGEFAQGLVDDRLHITIRYEYDSRHWIEERTVIHQEPRLVQEKWSWREVRDGEIQRKFEVDFLTGAASAEKLDVTSVNPEPAKALPGSQSLRDRSRGSASGRSQRFGGADQALNEASTLSSRGRLRRPRANALASLAADLRNPGKSRSH